MTTTMISTAAAATGAATIYVERASSSAFHKMGDAINYVVNNNLSSVNIKISPGNYTDEILYLPEKIGWVLEGSVSGAVQLGNIIWKASGKLDPIVPQSYLLLRQVAPLSIDIEDGTKPAEKALLILENSAIFGDIKSSGTSNLTAQISGQSPAASIVAGQNVSSIIIGNINLPNTSIGLTNSQIVGEINANILWAQGCQINQPISLTGNICQIKNSQLLSNSITFLNETGTVQFDINTGASWVSNNGTINNGKLTFEPNKVPKNIKVIDKDYVLTASDNVVVISKEEIITITLPANPTPGDSYSVVKYNSNTHIVVKDDFNLVNQKHSYSFPSEKYCVIQFLWLGFAWVATGGYNDT